MLHMLALHPDVQAQVREEVHAALASRRTRGDYSGRLGCDEIAGLKVLDAAIKETLRLYVPHLILDSERALLIKGSRYPPVPFVRRT